MECKSGHPRQDTALGRTKSTWGGRRQSPGEKFLFLGMAARSWTVLSTMKGPFGEHIYLNRCWSGQGWGGEIIGELLPPWDPAGCPRQDMGEELCPARWLLQLCPWQCQARPALGLAQEVVVIALAAPPGELDTLTLPATVVACKLVGVAPLIADPPPLKLHQ